MEHIITTIGKEITSKLGESLKIIEKYNHSDIKILSIKTSLDDTVEAQVSITYKRNGFSNHEEIRFNEKFNAYNFNVYNTGFHNLVVNNIYDKVLFEVTKWCCKNYEMEKIFGMEKDLIKKVLDFVDETEIFKNKEALDHEIFEELDGAYFYYEKCLERFFRFLILPNPDELLVCETSKFFVSFDDFIKRQDMENLNMMYDMMYGE